MNTTIMIISALAFSIILVPIILQARKEANEMNNKKKIKGDQLTKIQKLINSNK